jgi:hypothetical protein
VGLFPIMTPVCYRACIRIALSPSDLQSMRPSIGGGYVVVAGRVSHHLLNRTVLLVRVNDTHPEVKSKPQQASPSTISSVPLSESYKLMVLQSSGLRRWRL